jgi:hypothetical protein
MENNYKVIYDIVGFILRMNDLQFTYQDLHKRSLKLHNNIAIIHAKPFSSHLQFFFSLIKFWKTFSEIFPREKRNLGSGERNHLCFQCYFGVGRKYNVLWNWQIYLFAYKLNVTRSKKQIRTFVPSNFLRVFRWGNCKF